MSSDAELVRQILARDPGAFAELLPPAEALWGLASLGHRGGGLAEIARLAGTEVAAPNSVLNEDTLSPDTRRTETKGRHPAGWMPPYLASRYPSDFSSLGGRFFGLNDRSSARSTSPIDRPSIDFRISLPTRTVGASFFERRAT